ncbi:endonuclease domain-containing protein [Gordonia spumicola]|uniref:endonuclease domain-containing protein n=1 Tax=Gordonia spumicola TaxID=589161 RepID=UPI0035308755
MATGNARQLRRGWYLIGSPPGDIVDAVRRGGVLSCVSALRRLGVWVPGEKNHLHVRGNNWAVRNLRGPFCKRFGRPEPEYAVMDDVETALQYAARCLNDTDFIVVCDSILNKRLMTLEQMQYQFRNAPKRTLALLDRCDERADSGPETVIRLFLTSLNVKFDLQVTIDGVGCVDILIGDWLIIELDGWEFHGDKEHFESDRRRDVDAHALGFTPLRFTYKQTMHTTDVTTAKIHEAIRAGVHLRPSHPVQSSPLTRGTA